MSDTPTSPEAGLRILADWFDSKYPHDPDTQVQSDLRRWAAEIERLRAALEVVDDAYELGQPIYELRADGTYWESNRIVRLRPNWNEAVRAGGDSRLWDPIQGNPRCAYHCDCGWFCGVRDNVCPQCGKQGPNWPYRGDGVCEGGGR